MNPECVPMYTDIHLRFFRDLACGGKPDSSGERGKDMETILIVVLILFLFGGGSWGYSRWRN